MIFASQTPISIQKLNKKEKLNTSRGFWAEKSNNTKFTSLDMPCDFRLGNKLRVISELPFPWMKKMTSSGVYPVNPHILPVHFDTAMSLIRKPTIPTNPIDPLIFLQAAAMYHQFPSIGSVKLFPRRTLGSRSTLKSANLQLIEPDFIDTLKINWNESFRFLFNRWVVGSRQSFYLCSTHFTIIFINLSNKNFCALDAKTTSFETPQKDYIENNNNSPFNKKLAQKRKRTLFENKTNIFYESPSKNCIAIESTVNSQPRIVITPTTSGFRQILQKNDINFTLPFKSDFIALNREESPTDFLPNEEDSTSNLDHDEWLKEIGISPKGSLRLKQSASELDASDLSNSLPASELTRMSTTSDSPPIDPLRSTIIIKGTNDVENFYNLLLSQPQLICTKTGPQSGLPPTLISHSPFRHSALNELSMTSQLFKKAGKIKYILELEHGPILPTSLDFLFQFVKNSVSANTTNRVKLQVTGRNQCNGMNEALKKEKSSDVMAINFNELEWDGCKFEYC